MKQFTKSCTFAFKLNHKCVSTIDFLAQETILAIGVFLIFFIETNRFRHIEIRVEPKPDSQRTLFSIGNKKRHYDRNIIKLRSLTRRFIRRQKKAIRPTHNFAIVSVERRAYTLLSSDFEFFFLKFFFTADQTISYRYVVRRR